MSAEAFFQKKFPTLVSMRLDRFSRLTGALAFSCGGEKWTIRMGYLDVPVAPIFERQADVKLWFKPGAFERFVAGERPRAGELRIQGDPAVLERFGRFLGDDAKLGYEV